MIKLLFCNIPNFGDQLNSWLVYKLTGERPVLANPLIEPHYLAVGTFITNATELTTVWGAGLGLPGEHPQRGKPKILAVRGPLTRNLLLDLDVECPEVYGDPGLLISDLYRPNVPKTHKYGLIPHYVDQDEYKQAYMAKFPGVKYISLWQRRIERVIEDILSCEIIISSSLHGLITPVAYGIPVVWIQISTDKIGSPIFKYRDFFLTVGQDPEPIHIRDLNMENIGSHIIRGSKYDLTKLKEVNPFKKEEKNG